MDELRLNIFKDLSSYESRLVSIQEILWWIQHDESVKNKTELYRHLAKTVNRDEANKKVKSAMMPAFSVAAQFKTLGKQVTHITRVTGLCLCDLDHIENEKIKKLKNEIHSDPHVVMCYTTISGEGLRIIFRYVDADGRPPENATLYRAAYLKGNAYFAKMAGVDYDGQCSNLTRLSGIAHDPEVFLNTDAEPFIITDEEAAEANLAPGTEPGKPRKEFPAGTHEAEAEAAWALIEPMLSKRNIVYGPHTHHQYVMHACHLFNRFGVRENDLQEWAAQNWSDYQAQDRNDLIRWVYQNRQQEHGTWRLSRQGRHGEVSMISLPDLCRWLSHHGLEIIFNQITDQRWWRLKGNTEWKLMDEETLCSIRKEMAADTGKRILKNDILDIIRSNYAQQVHPIRDYIQDLPPWDKTDRVSLLAAHISTEAVQQGQSAEAAHELLSWAMHKWLVAAVAGWLCDEACNQTILTLIGPQGIYKTTFFRYLLPPPLRSYFWENSHNSFTSKDDQIALTENCLVDIEEIDMFHDRDNAELKSLATRIKLKIRRPYDKFPLEKHRLASLCATGNQERFLTDETGDRRWLCFLVSRIDDPRRWELDYDQLYAQLRDEYYDGFQYWFDKDEELRIQRQNAYFRIVSDEEQLISSRFRIPRPGDTPVKRLRPAAIAQMISYGRIPISSRKVGQVLRKLGFKWQHTESGSVYQVFEMTPDQAQSALSESISKESTEDQALPKEETLPF